MTAYERAIIKTIYPKACQGDIRAIKILHNLTTKRNKGPKCRMCGKRFKPRPAGGKRTNHHCSVKCYQFSRHRKKLNP